MAGNDKTKLIDKSVTTSSSVSKLGVLPSLSLGATAAAGIFTPFLERKRTNTQISNQQTQLDQSLDSIRDQLKFSQGLGGMSFGEPFNQISKTRKTLTDRLDSSKTSRGEAVISSLTNALTLPFLLG